MAGDRGAGPLRLPVQWVIRPEESARRERRYAGQIAGGTLRPGDEVMVMPSGATSKVLAVETFDGPVEAAVPPDSVTVQIADDLDIGRGEMIVSVEDPPTAGRHLEATVCWMSEQPLRAGEHVALKHTTRTVRAAVESIDWLLDVETLQETKPPDQLELNDIARVTLRTSAPIVADRYDDNRTTGAFILVDEDSNDTVAAGMLREIRETPPKEQPHSPGVTWHETGLRRGQRWSSLRTRGATVWLTGLPASGKSSIAAALERSLVESGHAAYFLDGDNLRHGISGDLAFSPADRTENIRRVAHLARLMADSGMVAIASLVSPTRHDRALARELHQAAGLKFLEVYVNTPLEVCEARDPKGLYARARAGKLLDFTGVSAPYEAPQQPDVLIQGADEDAAIAAARIREALEQAWAWSRLSERRAQSRRRPARPVPARQWTGREPPRDRPPRLRRVLRVGRAAAPARTWSASRSWWPGAGHARWSRRPPTRRASTASARPRRPPRRGACARRPSSSSPTSRPTRRSRARSGSSSRARLPVVSQVGLDEGYADVTECEKPLRVLRELVAEVQARTGITISVGVGPNRLIAKVSSDLEKPRGFVAMGREEACRRLASASPRIIPGFGPKTVERLAALGYTTIGAHPAGRSGDARRAASARGTGATCTSARTSTAPTWSSPSRARRSRARRRRRSTATSPTRPSSRRCWAGWRPSSPRGCARRRSAGGPWRSRSASTTGRR